MSILSGKEIARLIKSGRIVIEPFSPDQIGEGSVDLHLGYSFRLFHKKKYTLHAKAATDYLQHSRMIKLRKGQTLTIRPGELVHGITLEKITIPPSLCGWLEGRSSFARIGLMIHVTAGFLQPGSSGRQVLEISNLSPHPIVIYPGTRVCQIVLEEVKNPGKGYAGRFAGQRMP